MSTYEQNFRGHRACPCQVEWLPVFETEAQRRGTLTGYLPLSQLIGGAAASGGTHSKGGADDTYPLHTITDVDAYVELSREMGADATWHRPKNWDGADGVEHVHRVLRGCPHNEPARYQITAVDAGFNGLGHLGHGAKDDGPRPLSGRTWRQGIAWAEEQRQLQEDPMLALLKDLRAVANQHGVTLPYAARVLLWAASKSNKGGRLARINAARVPLKGMDDPK